jgi:GntR family transcriptional regulator/MocR family aminotransferase
MRGSAGLVPWLDLDQHDEVPLYLQLYEQVRRSVLSGRLAAGARLPSSRTLASELGLSRTTVIQAYDRLWSEGYLTAKVGSGTRVTATLPEDRLAAAASPQQASPGRAAARLSHRAAALAPMLAGAGRLDVARPFLPGYPAVDLFPIGIWRRLAWRRLRARNQVDLLRPPEPAGHTALRSAIAEHLRLTRGVRCTAEQVVITTGTQQALARLTALLLDPGDAAWIEDPGYLGARRALLAAGARLVPVPVDDAGIDVDAGIAMEKQARLAYVTPSHQFPTGVTMSLERRLRLLQWAGDNEAWILEDDYDGEYRYEERPLQALQGMDGSGQVIYMGTFGKILFPSLRLGYVILPAPLVGPFVAARAADGGAPPLLDQLVLADFLRDEHFARHLRRMRLVYRDRRDALVDALTRRCAAHLTPGPAGAGIHLVATLHRGSDRAIAKRAAERGLTAFALSEFALEPRTPGGLVLGFAGWSPARIRSAVELLSTALT